MMTLCREHLGVIGRLSKECSVVFRWFKGKITDTRRFTMKRIPMLLSLSQSPYSTLVAGIYSTRPGVVASTRRVDEALLNDEVPLAVVGIVPCKVTAENGPIVAGDLLVSSSIPGHAMKGTDRGRLVGAVVGKALEPLQKGTGVIQVLATLQ
jgi:hypothetical protein